MKSTWSEDEWKTLRTELVAYATRLLGTGKFHLAEDLAHEVLANALSVEHAPTEPERFEVYLRTAIRHRMSSHWKKCAVAREEALPEGTPTQECEPKAPPALSASRLAKLRERLSFEEETTLFLRTRLGCSFDAISFILNLPSSQAARRFHSRTVQRFGGIVNRDLGLPTKLQSNG